ncbi:MAG: hypothetical protein ABSB41_03345 [Anaerolineales bacterium]
MITHLFLIEEMNGRVAQGSPQVRPILTPPGWPLLTTAASRRRSTGFDLPSKSPEQEEDADVARFQTGRQLAELPRRVAN